MIQNKDKKERLSSQIRVVVMNAGVGRSTAEAFLTKGWSSGLGARYDWFAGSHVLSWPPPPPLLHLLFLLLSSSSPLTLLPLSSPLLSSLLPLLFAHSFAFSLYPFFIVRRSSFFFTAIKVRYFLFFCIIFFSSFFFFSVLFPIYFVLLTYATWSIYVVMVTFFPISHYHFLYSFFVSLNFLHFGSQHSYLSPFLTLFIYFPYHGFPKYCFFPWRLCLSFNSLFHILFFGKTIEFLAISRQSYIVVDGGKWT